MARRGPCSCPIPEPTAARAATNATGPLCALCRLAIPPARLRADRDDALRAARVGLTERVKAAGERIGAHLARIARTGSPLELRLLRDLAADLDRHEDLLLAALRARPGRGTMYPERATQPAMEKETR